MKEKNLVTSLIGQKVRVYQDPTEFSKGTIVTIYLDTFDCPRYTVKTTEGQLVNVDGSYLWFT